MQAAILAGGLGTRLRPLTDKVPKAMAPVNGRPFLEYELELLASHGVDDIVLCVGYKGEMIRGHFGDGSAFGVRIRYSSEGERLLGQEELAVMAVYRNQGRFGRNDVVVKDGFVTAYDKVNQVPGMEWINFGVTAMKRGALAKVEPGRVTDEPTFYGMLVRERQLRALEADERFYEVGSERSLAEFAEFVSSRRATRGVPMETLRDELHPPQLGTFK